MCKADPVIRFSAAQVLQSPWVAKRDDGPLMTEDDTVCRAIAERIKCFSSVSRYKKAVAYLVAHSLPERKLAKLRKAFEEIDTNGDGMLTYQELQAALHRSGVGITPEAFKGI